MKVVLNIEKLKCSASIIGSERHVQRSINTPNADPSLKDKNHLIIGSDNRALYEEVKVAIAATGYRPRKNGVLCLEYMLTAGKKYWESNPGIIAAWKELNRQWLVNTYGKNCLRAAVHLDETCPHIHAYVVPITQDNRLSCYRFLGGREGLSQLQTNYAAAMASIGLERGIRKSRASHHNIKEFYGAITKNWSEGLNADEIDQQLAHREILVRQNAELERTCRYLSNNNLYLETSINELEIQIEELTSAIKSLSLQDRIYEHITSQRASQINSSRKL